MLRHAPPRPAGFGSRLLDEHDALEHVRVLHNASYSSSRSDLPPLRSGARTPSNPLSPYLQPMVLVGPGGSRQRKGHLTSSATANVLSQVVRPNSPFDSRQRAAIAGRLRENLVLKEKVCEMERQLRAQAEELCRLREAQASSHQAVAHRVSTIAALQAISTLLASNELDTLSMIEGLVELTSAALNCQRVSLFLLSEDGIELYLKTANDCVPDIRVPMGKGIVGNVAQTRTLVNIGDARSDPRTFRASDRQTGFTTVSILSAVVQTPAGTVVGVMQAINKRPSEQAELQPEPYAGAIPFGAEDEQLLTHIVSQATSALWNMMLYEQAVMARTRAQAQLDLINCVAFERNFRSLTRRVCEIVSDCLGARHALLLLYSAERKELWSMPDDEQPGWSISFPFSPEWDADSLAETLERRVLANNGRASARAGGGGAGQPEASSVDAAADSAAGQSAGEPVELSWLAWQVVRTGERLSWNHNHGGGPGPGSGLSVSLDVLAAPAELGAKPTASTLLAYPCYDAQQRVVAVVIAASKHRAARGLAHAGLSHAQLDPAHAASAQGGGRSSYFDAVDEELMLALSRKISIAFELRSLELVTSKVALDMASDASGAGRLAAYDLGKIPDGSVGARRGSLNMAKFQRAVRNRTVSLAAQLATAELSAGTSVSVARLQSWGLDLLDLGELELHSVALTCMRTFELPATLGFSAETFLRLCQRVSQGYRPNPYHNYCHAVNVMQVCFLVLTLTDLGSRLPRTSVLAVLLAALFHDLDHPGTNNAFQTNSGSALALLYNDQSVLENHHAASAFRLLREEPELDVLGGLSSKDRASVRAQTVHCILATDMGRHFALVNSLKSLSASPEEHSAADQLLLMETVVHAADLSNPLLEPVCSRRWSDAVLKEFNAQAALEQELGLPFDPKMLKSDIVTQANLNRGFIDYIVSPLWTALAQRFPQLEPGVAQMMRNREAWDKIITESGSEAARAEAGPRPQPVVQSPEPTDLDDEHE